MPRWPFLCSLTLLVGVLTLGPLGAVPPDTPIARSLLNLPLAGALLPTETAYVALVRSTWAPGASEVIPARSAQAGVLISLVLRGQLTLRAGSPVLVVRVATPNAPVVVPPLTKVTLQAGDAAVVERNSLGRMRQNPGPTSAVVLQAVVLAAAVPTVPPQPYPPPGVTFDPPALLPSSDWTRWRAGAAPTVVHLQLWQFRRDLRQPLAITAANELRLLVPASATAHTSTVYALTLARQNPSGTPVASPQSTPTEASSAS